jgi:hypothetical protein
METRVKSEWEIALLRLGAVATAVAIVNVLVITILPRLRLFRGSMAVFLLFGAATLLAAFWPGVALLFRKRIAGGLGMLLLGFVAWWFALFVSGLVAAMLTGGIGSPV